jgi:cyclopropane fatty-acyl-phospholipid synthase-like methyltransferase
MLGLVDHLASAVNRLTYKAAGTTWADYYANTNYSDAAMAEKRRLVTQFMEAARPATVWDLGANTGAFSVLAAESGAYTLALDFDPAAVERAVLAGQAHKERRILPLIMDLANPTGEMGWAHAERSSLADRGPADVVLALGLIHHLTLSNHVPFAMTADFLATIGRSVVIEFVPPTDSQVVGMLSRMPRAEEGYTQAAFETAYRERFDVRASEPIAGTERTLYHMTPRGNR